MIIKLKLAVPGVFSVFLQHYMYQTWMCVLQIHSLLLRWKKANYCKIQVSSLRRFAFATLRWPHCVRPPTPLRQPGSATRLITVLAPLPAHSGAQITWPLYNVFYWTKIVWHWLQHWVIMINHDISWYITKYQIISDNIRQYHDISRFITIYHDISWYIKNYQVNSEHWKLTLNSENDIKLQ